MDQNHPGIFPEDLGFVSDDTRFNKDIYDCNDQIIGETSFIHYKDSDEDRVGTLPALGQTCDKTKITNYHDCNDNDPLILGTFKYGRPDVTVCNKDEFRVGINGKDLEITVGPEHVLENEDGTPKKPFEFTYEAFVNNVKSSSIYAYPCATGSNCPSGWIVDRRAGKVTWTDVNFDGLTPTAPFENGRFDPEKPAKFRAKISVGTGFGGGYQTSAYLTINYEPGCPELKTHEGRRQIMELGYPKGPALEPDTYYRAIFAPKCPSGGAPVKLKDLATAMGFEHFNWIQGIAFPQSDVFEVETSVLISAIPPQGSVDTTVSLPLSKVSKVNQFSIDPVYNGKFKLITAKDLSGVQRGWVIPPYDIDTGKPFDNLPFYLEEPGEASSPQFLNEYELRFEDSPSAPIGWFTDRFNKPRTQFQIAVAGVKGGVFMTWSTLHNWSSNKENPRPKPTEPPAPLIAPVKYVTKRTTAPAEYSTWPGTNSFVGNSNVGLYPTPPLIGKNINNAESINPMIQGSSFSIEVASQIASDEPIGEVLSQIPAEWEAIANPGPIKVVVSNGPAKPCGSIPSGGTTIRTRYKSSTVPYGSTCDSVKETQTGTCNDGTLTFTGSGTSDSCVISSKPIDCKKQTKLKCKAKIFGITKCELPVNLISIKKDDKYKGSRCHAAPTSVKTIWNALQYINSYSIKENSVNANLGCDIQFDLSYKDKCTK